MTLAASTSKRAIDLVGAMGMIMLLAPALGAAAVAVWLASGRPVLFRQVRIGRKGCAFTCYKFRTMVLGAPDLRNVDGSTFNADDDPRITAVGRVLRRLSIDELPQLFNVVRGEMSLVGPRPDLPDQVRTYSELEKRRLLVKPGITGLAQVRGRNALPVAMRRQLDAEYAERQSLRLDVAILARTMAVAVSGHGLHRPPSRDERQ